MSVGGVNMNGAAPAGTPGEGVNPQIRALEQKLQQLTQEKQKAAKAQDSKKSKNLDEQIQQIRRQIAELSRKSGANRTNNAAQTEDAKSILNDANPATAPSGRNLDELV